MKRDSVAALKNDRYWRCCYICLPILDTVLLNEKYRLNSVLFGFYFSIQAVLNCPCSLQASLTRPNKAAYQLTSPVSPTRTDNMARQAPFTQRLVKFPLQLIAWYGTLCFIFRVTNLERCILQKLTRVRPATSTRRSDLPNKILKLLFTCLLGLQERSATRPTRRHTTQLSPALSEDATHHLSPLFDQLKRQLPCSNLAAR